MRRLSRTMRSSRLPCSRLAIAYVRSNQLRKATDIAQKARQAYPDDPKVADALGWILFKNGEYDKALPLLRDSAAKLPDQAEAQFHLGMAHYMLGEEEQARVALQNAVNATGDFPEKSEARQRLQVLSISDAVDQFLQSRDRNWKISFARTRTILSRYFNWRGCRTVKVRRSKRSAPTKRSSLSNSNFLPALRQLAVLYGLQRPRT